jgi:hypothetical protein
MQIMKEVALPLQKVPHTIGLSLGTGKVGKCPPLRYEI